MLFWLPWIIRGVMLLAVVASFWWAWDHYIKDPYVAQGRAEVQGQLDQAVAANSALSADLKILQGKVKEQDDALTQLKGESDKKLQTKNSELAALKAKEAQHAKDLERSTQIVVGPPAPTKELACESATSTLHDLAARRLRD